MVFYFYFLRKMWRFILILRLFGISTPKLKVYMWTIRQLKSIRYMITHFFFLTLIFEQNSQCYCFHIYLNAPFQELMKKSAWRFSFLEIYFVYTSCTVSANLILKASFLSFCQYQTYQWKFTAEYQLCFKIIYRFKNSTGQC